jgi:ketosteroid isomerase-like protein
VFDDQALRGIIARIEATFGRDMDAWLACFDEPMVFVSAPGTMTFPSHADARAFFTGQWDALRSAGFASTHADAISVSALGDDIALVDAHFTRRRADGTEMEQLDALYVCRRKGDDGWIVAALVRH